MQSEIISTPIYVECYQGYQSKICIQEFWYFVSGLDTQLNDMWMKYAIEHPIYNICISKYAKYANNQLKGHMQKHCPKSSAIYFADKTFRVLLSFWMALSRNGQMTSRGSNLHSNLKSAAWPGRYKGFICCKIPGSAVWSLILLRSEFFLGLMKMPNLKTEASWEWFPTLLPNDARQSSLPMMLLSWNGKSLLLWLLLCFASRCSHPTCLWLS